MSFVLKGLRGDHFQHLNHFFGNGFDSNELVEHSQKIDHPEVDGHSDEWYFDGIRMGYSDWRYKRAAELGWSYSLKIDLITFQANLRGSLFFGGDNGRQFQLFGANQHNLSYANANDSNEGIMVGDRLRSSMFFIQFTKEAFLRLTAGGNDALNRFSENVVKGQPALLAPRHLVVDAAMLNLVNNILNCRYAGHLKKMFLLSKSIEFLVLQAEACNAAMMPSYHYIKTAQDMERMRYAREYVMSHLDAPPSLSALARIIGTNEYKLKRGFKEVFGNTVFGYISEARLEIAKNDLLEGTRTASELASALGYSSLQHFSAAFRKKFGRSPGRLKG